MEQLRKNLKDAGENTSDLFPGSFHDNMAGFCSRDAWFRYAKQFIRHIYTLLENITAREIVTNTRTHVCAGLQHPRYCKHTR